MDGRSRLENGRVGAGVAWYEEVTDDEGRVFVDRRGCRTAGQRRETGHITYLGK